MLKKFSLMLLIMSFFSMAAFAQTTTSFPGIAPSHVKDFYLDGGVGLDITNDKDPGSNGLAGVAFLGYQFNKYFGAEAGVNYISHGHTLVPVVVKGTLPVSADKRFKVFSKLGAALTNSDIKPYVGLGAAYAIKPDFDVAVEINGTNLPFSDMGSATLNLIHYF